MQIKETLTKFKNFDQLDNTLKNQYRKCVQDAFPEVIFKSDIVNSLWIKVEKYFPTYQRTLIDHDSNILGIINTIPFNWNEGLNELPNDGWDWLMKKGINDYENNIKSNCLGGLQIIITKENQGKGYSKIFIAEGKDIQLKNQLENFVIPIRPTFKYKHPQMLMKEYINLKEKNKIFDPWIRTHIKSGAKILKVCSNSMNISGNLKMWESLTEQKITKTGHYIISGALNPVYIDITKDYGEYREENVWIAH